MLRGVQSPEFRWPVVGILLEQYPDRQHRDRASNVLFAATIQEAMQRFTHLDFGNLIQDLPSWSGDTRLPAPAEHNHNPDVDSMVSTTEHILRALTSWEEAGIIDPQLAKATKKQVMKSFTEAIAALASQHHMHQSPKPTWMRRLIDTLEKAILRCRGR